MAGCCSTLGCHRLNQNIASLSVPPPNQKRLVVYNLGNGQTTTNADDAKRSLLERDFKEFTEFENIEQNDYIHGLIGAKFLPPVFVTKIPKVSEPLDYEILYHQKMSDITKEEHSKYLQIIAQENAERTVFDGLVSFFDDYHSNEDVFVVFNQDISDQTKQPNPTWKELDAIVINSTKGYILVIEAKAKLTPKKMKKTSEQLQKAKDIIEKNWLSNLKQNWTFFSVIYTDHISDNFNICSNCKPFIISSAEGKIYFFVI